MYSGITEGTFYRDQTWHFYEIGRYLERADQTTRLLDMKYHLLLPQPSDIGSPIDVRQWHALLRSAAGYHAYRKLHPRGMTPGQVAGFLLLNPQFPRSVYLCVCQIERLLAELKAHYGAARRQRSGRAVGQCARAAGRSVHHGDPLARPARDAGPDPAPAEPE